MNRKHIGGRLALWGTAFLWGTSFVIVKNTLDSIGVLWILALRFLGAAILLALAAGKKLFTLDRRSFIGSVLGTMEYGLFGILCQAIPDGYPSLPLLYSSIPKRRVLSDLSLL